MVQKLTHIDAEGAAEMVDVSGKTPTARRAVAVGFVYMAAATLEAVRSGSIEKGEVLSVARLAGIMAAKRTDDLIPLCHGLPIEHVRVDFEFVSEPSCIAIRASASTSAKTGVEMEALTAVTVSALTVYDMAKALDKSMSIGDVHLRTKVGGKSGVYQHPDPPGPVVWTGDL